MKKIYKPKNIPNKYNSFIFVKFCKEENHAKSLREGILHMRSLDYFANLENGGRGDNFENKDLIVMSTENECADFDMKEINGSMAFVFTPREKKTEEDDGVYFAFEDRDCKNKKIFCLYTLWFNTESGEIYEIDERAKKEFGRYCCVIYKPMKFIERLSDSLNNNSNSCKLIDRKFVNYIDTNDKVIHDWNPYLKALDEYGYQNEFRILVETETEAEVLNYKLNCIDLKDISCVTTFEDLKEKFHIENNQLYISNE